MGEERDLPPGRRLVECFTLFLVDLAASGLSTRTIRKHVDNLWILGGEIIRDLNETPSLRRKDVEHLLFDVLDDEGGPLIHNGSEDEQRSFDSTCRKFHRFLTQSHRWTSTVTHRFPRRAIISSPVRVPYSMKSWLAARFGRLYSRSLHSTSRNTRTAKA
jgi:hypothetical protein